MNNQEIMLPVEVQNHALGFFADRENLRKTCIAIGPVVMASVTLFMASCSTNREPNNPSQRMFTDSKGQQLAGTCVEDDPKTSTIEDRVVKFDDCEKNDDNSRHRSIIYGRPGYSPAVGSRYASSYSSKNPNSSISSDVTAGRGVKLPATSAGKSVASAEFGGFGKSSSIGKSGSSGKSSGFGGKTGGFGRGASS